MFEANPVDEPDSLRVDIQVAAKSVLVEVSGEIDMLTAHELWVATREAVVEAEGRPVVIDLTGVLFLGSHGLAVLVRLAEEATRQGSTLRVVAAPGRPARRPIELTGLNEVLGLRPTVHEAVRG